MESNHRFLDVNRIVVPCHRTVIFSGPTNDPDFRLATPVSFCWTMSFIWQARFVIKHAFRT